ncbi:MAG: ABC transporter permease, partial [Thermomicrobiales bacterium]|nr:ABC transporter permease [Thermomicrobiales bacterium]
MKANDARGAIGLETEAVAGAATAALPAIADVPPPPLLPRLLGSREAMTVGLLIVAFVAGALLSPYFLDAAYLLSATSLYMEIGIIALPMTLIIIAGDIDLSVASTLALVASATAVLWSQVGLPLPAAIVCGLALGALCGALNGALIVGLGLPSLTVTLGTLALYRGIAQILIGDHSIGGFPSWAVGIDTWRVPGSPIPVTLVFFLLLALGFGLLLHRTVFGRLIYATGANREAARYAGVATGRVRLILFVLSGFLAGLAGMIMTSRLGVARFDLANGLELDVITAVVLGGTDIFGGRGSIFGTVVA